MPSGDGISSVPLVEQGHKDPPGHTEKEKGRASLNLKETAQTVATWLQNIRGAQHEEALGQDLEVYIGEGLPPVPQKLVDRIQKGEFIEMCELLPEFWIAPREGEEASGLKLAKSKGRKHTQDICVWLQCFAVYVAVVSRWPKQVPELMTYMIHIIRTSQEYEGYRGLYMTRLIGGKLQPLSTWHGQRLTLRSSRCVSRLKPGGVRDVSGA